MISCWFFMGSCFVLTFCVLFFTGFFPFVVLVVSFSQKLNCLVWICLPIFLVFYVFFVRLINSLQKNKLSGYLSWFNSVWVPWVFLTISVIVLSMFFFLLGIDIGYCQNRKQKLSVSIHEICVTINF